MNSEAFAAFEFAAKQQANAVQCINTCLNAYVGAAVAAGADLDEALRVLVGAGESLKTAVDGFVSFALAGGEL